MQLLRSSTVIGGWDQRKSSNIVTIQARQFFRSENSTKSRYIIGKKKVDLRKIGINFGRQKFWSEAKILVGVSDVICLSRWMLVVFGASFLLAQP